MTSSFAPQLPQVFNLSSDFVVSDAAHHDSDDEEDAAEVLPDTVKQFLQWWYRQYLDQKTFELHAVYENHFGKITERYYKASAWPAAESIAALVRDDGLFLLLYKTLYFKHAFATLPVTLEQRAEALANTAALFDYLLGVAQPADVPLDLPLAWLWHIVDSFTSAVLDLAYLRRGADCSALADDVGTIDGALEQLRRLADKAGVAQALQSAAADGAAADDGNAFAAHPLYYTLGYFALIAQTRLLCARGEYQAAIDASRAIDVSKEGLFGREPACQVSFFHSLAFAQLMCARHVDSVRVSSALLLFVQRTKQYATRLYHFNNLIKKADRVYALLALASALFASPIEEALLNQVRDKYSDAMVRVTRGDVAAFDELFCKACPRHLPAAAAADADDAAAQQKKRAPKSSDSARIIGNQARNAAKAAAKRQHAIVEKAMPQLRSVLAIYASISVAKLASVLQIDETECRKQLDAYSAAVDAKHDLSFTIDANNMLAVHDAPKPREKPSDFFLSALHKIGPAH